LEAAGSRKLEAGSYKRESRNDRSNRRHAFAHPERDDCPARTGRYAFIASQGGDRAILESEGYIQSFKVLEPQGGERVQAHLRMFLKYGPRGERLISGIQRVSRPGRRVYFGRDEVPDVLAGLGTSILTTSRGVMTGREAVKAGVGGEVLCNVW